MADRYWVAAGASNWNNTANWSTSSGGAGGASVPVAADRAFFNSAAAGSCTVDIDLTGANAIGELRIQTYAGSINATGRTIDIVTTGGQNGRLYVSGAGSTTTLISGTWNIYGDYNMSAATGYTRISSGTYNLRGTGNAYVAQIYNSFISVYGTYTLQGSGTLYFVNGKWLRVRAGGTLTMTSAATIRAQGNVTVTVYSGGAINGGVGVVWLIDAYFNNAGTVDVGTISTDSNSCTIYAGTFKCVNFYLKATVTYFIGNVKIDGNLAVYTSADRVYNNTNNPSLEITGNFSCAATTWWQKGNGTITLSGTSAQNVNIGSNTIEKLIINKASGTATLTNHLVSDGLEVLSGTLDTNSKNITCTNRDIVIAYPGAVTKANIIGTTWSCRDFTCSGTVSNQVDLSATSSWTLTCSRWGGMEYTDVAYCDASGSAYAIDAANNCTDNSNNQNFFFADTTTRYWNPISATTLDGGVAWARNSGGKPWAPVANTNKCIFDATNSQQNCTGGTTFNCAEVEISEFTGDINFGSVTMNIGQVSGTGNFTIIRTADSNTIDFGTGTIDVYGNFDSKGVTRTNYFTPNTAVLNMRGVSKVVECSDQPLPNMTMITAHALANTSKSAAIWTNANLELQATLTVPSGVVARMVSATQGLSVKVAGQLTGAGALELVDGRINENSNVIDISEIRSRGDDFIAAATYASPIKCYNNTDAQNSSTVFGAGTTIFNGVFSLYHEGSGTKTVDNSVNNPNLNFKNDFVVGAGLTAWTTGSGTLTFSASSSQDVTSAGKVLETVVIANTAATVLQDAFAASNLTMSSGSFNPNGQTIAISQNVVISDPATINLAGLAGSTWTIYGNFNCSGTVGTHMNLSAASVWFLNVFGVGTATYTDVAYSDAATSYFYINASDGTNTDNGNNVKWEFLVAPSYRYWVAGSPSNWNNTANWSTTSGGAGGSSVPVVTDNVIFDSQGSGNCTVDATVSIKALVSTSFVGTIDNSVSNPNWSTPGAFVIGASAAWTKGTGTITLLGAGAGLQPLNANSKSLEDLVINDSGGGRRTLSAITTESITVSAGGFNNPYNATISGNFSAPTTGDITGASGTTWEVFGHFDLTGMTGTVNSDSFTLKMSGSGAATVTSNGQSLGSMYVNKSAGVAVTQSGDATYIGSFHMQTGNYNLGLDNITIGTACSSASGSNQFILGTNSTSIITLLTSSLSLHTFKFTIQNETLRMMGTNVNLSGGFTTGEGLVANVEIYGSCSFQGGAFVPTIGKIANPASGILKVKAGATLSLVGAGAIAHHLYVESGATLAAGTLTARITRNIMQMDGALTGTTGYIYFNTGYSPTAYDYKMAGGVYGIDVRVRWDLPVASTFTFLGDIECDKNLQFYTGGTPGANLTIRSSINNPNFLFHKNFLLPNNSRFPYQKGTGTITMDGSSGSGALQVYAVNGYAEDVVVNGGANPITLTTVFANSLTINSGTIGFHASINDIDVLEDLKIYDPAIIDTTNMGGEAIVVGRDFIVEGALGTPILLNPSAWTLDVTRYGGTKYCTIANSNAGASTAAIDAGDGTNTDSSGNTNWNFSDAARYWNPSGPANWSDLVWARVDAGMPWASAPTVSKSANFTALNANDCVVDVASVSISDFNAAGYMGTITNSGNPDMAITGDMLLGPSTTWVKGTGTITFNGTGDKDLDGRGQALEDIVISKSSGITLTGNLVTDSLTITSGTFNPGGYDIIVTNDCTITTPAQIDNTGLTGVLWIVGGNFTCTGSVGVLTALNSAGGWTLSITGFGIAVYCNVQNCDASSGSKIDAGDGTNTDNGGNLNWHFTDTERYWQTATAKNWSDGADAWSRFAGGPVRASAPDNTMAVVFDGAFNGSCTVDVANAYVTEFSMSEYTGQFNCGNGNVYVGDAGGTGDVEIKHADSGGTFDFQSSTWHIYGNLTYHNDNNKIARASNEIKMYGTSKTLWPNDKIVIETLTVLGNISLKEDELGGNIVHLKVNKALELNAPTSAELHAASKPVSVGGEYVGVKSVSIPAGTVLDAHTLNVIAASITDAAGSITLTALNINAYSDLSVAAGAYDVVDVLITHAVASGSKTVTLGSGSFSFTGNIEVALSAASASLAVSNSANNPNIQLAGGLQFTGTQKAGISWAKGTGSITLSGAGSGTQDIDVLDNALEDIVINDSGAIKRLLSSLTTDSLNIAVGTFNANVGDLTCAGDFTGDAVGAIYSYGSGEWHVGGDFKAKRSGITRGSATIYLEGASKTCKNFDVSGLVVSGSYTINTSDDIAVAGTVFEISGSFAGNSVTAVLTGLANVKIDGALSSLTASLVSSIMTSFTGTISNCEFLVKTGSSILAGTYSASNVTFMEPTTHTLAVGIFDVYDLVFNPGAGAMTVSMANNPSLTIRGDLKVEDSGGGSVTYTKGTGTISMLGTGDKVIDMKDLSLEDMIINKASGITLDSDLRVESLDIQNGSFNSNGYDVVITVGDLTIAVSVTYTNSAGVGYIMFIGSGNQNLTQNTASILDNVAVEKGGGEFKLLTNISVYAFFGNIGDINLNNKNVTTVGYFSIDPLADIVPVTSLNGITINVGSNLDFAGSAGNLLDLKATVEWFLNVVGETMATYVDVSNSNALGGEKIMVNTDTSVDSGGNSNWAFGTAIKRGGARYPIPQMLDMINDVFGSPTISK